MESELLEDDFNLAVSTRLYLCERQRDVQDVKAQARAVGHEVARILAPLWGGEVKEADGPDEWRGCVDGEGHVFVDGECSKCDLINKDGVMSYGPAPAECEEHDLENGACRKCGGRQIPGTDFVTKATPLVIKCAHPKVFKNPDGRRRCLTCGKVMACEHENFKPYQGQLRCLDCGSVGN